MKTVFTDVSAIAHMWANQTQDEAKTPSRNFYYNGKTIYSYGSHFPIAKHVENSEGIKAVLFTERTYSPTTTKHIAVVRQASRHLNVIYCYNPESSHAENFRSWTVQIENIAEKLLKAKKPEIYLSQIEQIAATAKVYATYFNVEIPAKLSVAVSISNKAEYSQYAAKKQELEQAEKKQAQKELAKRHKKEITKWLKGQSSRLYTHDGFDYLRLNDNRIQTSQAVEIPIEIGRKIYNQLRDHKLQVGQQILDYRINEVSNVVKVGCHTFKTNYLLQFGQKYLN